MQSFYRKNFHLQQSKLVKLLQFFPEGHSSVSSQTQHVQHRDGGQSPIQVTELSTYQRSFNVVFSFVITMHGHQAAFCAAATFVRYSII